MVGVRGARNKDILQVRGYVRRIKGIVQTRFLLFIETSFTESSIILLYNKQLCSSKYNVIWKHTTLSIKHHSVNCSVRVCFYAFDFDELTHDVIDYDRRHTVREVARVASIIKKNM